MAVIYLASFQIVAHRALTRRTSHSASTSPLCLIQAPFITFPRMTYYVSVRSTLFGLFPSQHLSFGNRAESAGPMSHFQTNSQTQRLMALTGLALNDSLIARTLLHTDTASLRWLQTN